MIRRLLAVTVCAAALLATSACGQDTTAGRAADQTDATPSTGTPPAVVATDAPTPEPAWPASGCAPSVTSIASGSQPQGYPTPEAAMANLRLGHLPRGTVVAAPLGEDGTPRVWIVDPASNQIRAEASLTRGAKGWVVNSVTTCA